MGKPDPPRDEQYWATHDLEDWGGTMCRGIAYATTGAPVPSGTKAVIRKISTGRKHRGMASDSPRLGWVDGLP